MNDWMKNIPSDYLISNINLPGTHNSCAQFINFRLISKCQNKNIFDQLSMGIRFLDIRLKFDGESIGTIIEIHGTGSLHHGGGYYYTKIR